jgi:head-tail adaptor
VTPTALIDLLVLGAELEPARREGLLEDLSDLVLRHSGAQAWAYAREVADGAAYAAGRPMSKPHYRVHVTLPVAATAGVRERLAREVACRVLRVERAYPRPDDLPRVSVSFT